ncbi:6095_t:CDS:2 [Rhizophagus irregularis]|nr:6095_t:CDS:2 [Rhizophagus irregularis]
MIHLMHPLKCEWLPYDDNYPYLLLEEYPECEPELLLTFYTRPPKHIAVYKSYFPSSQTANPFHSAYHLPDDDSAPPYLPNNIVVPNSSKYKSMLEEYEYLEKIAAQPLPLQM